LVGWARGHQSPWILTISHAFRKKVYGKTQKNSAMVIFFLGAQNRQKATQFSGKGIFCSKISLLEIKTFAKFRQKTGLGGGAVATFMCTGYTFMSL
jgi:hypothetical protein